MPDSRYIIRMKTIVEKSLLAAALTAVLFFAGCGREDVSAQLGEAADALEKGKPETAQAITERAIAAAPKNADALILHALTREAQDDLTSAVNAATRAAQLQPGSFVAQYTCGRLCAAAGNDAAALHALGKALELNPGDRNTLILLANVNMRGAASTKERLAALRCLAALSGDGVLVRSAAYRNQIGIGMVLEKNLRKGGENLRYAQKLEPKNPVYQLNYARLFDYYLKRPDIAADYYREYLKLATASGNGLYRITEARLRAIGR